MTSTQFFFAQTLAKLGFPRTQKRLLDAADEVHLLKEAQEVLGQNIWPNLKDEPEYKDTIWEIEQLLDEKAKLTEQAEELNVEVEELRDNQNNQFKIPDKSNDNDQQQLRLKQSKVTELKSELANVKSEALKIRREHDEAKNYLNDITNSGETNLEILTAQKMKIASYKESFATLKEQKNTLDKQLATAQLNFEKISNTIKNSDNAQHNSTVEQFRVLGEKNKEISTVLSRVGLIDNKIASLYNDLGRHISLDALKNPNCKQLIKEHFGLCKIMHALRKSINYNHILGGRA